MQSKALAELIASNIALNPAMAQDLLGVISQQRVRSQQGSPYERAVIRSFRRRGYTDIRPNENIRTFRGWLDVDRIVRTGQKAAKSKFHAPLFHIDQTDPAPITRAEMQALLTKQNFKCKPCGDDLAQIPSHRLRPDPRGILCQRCSQALRNLNDMPDRILRLADYARSGPASVKSPASTPTRKRQAAKPAKRPPARKTIKAKGKKRSLH